MKKTISIFCAVPLLFLCCSCSITDTEQTLLDKYSKSGSPQVLCELIYFYQQEDNYPKIVEYTEMFLDEKIFSFDDVDFLGIDSNSRFLDEDEFLKEYIRSCCYVYQGEKYLESVILAYGDLSDKITGLTTCHTSIDEYFRKTSDINTCLDLYDELINESNNSVLKRGLAEWKLYFLEEHSKDKQLIQNARAQYQQYDTIVKSDIADSRDKGVPLEEYLGNLSRDGSMIDPENN